MKMSSARRRMSSFSRVTSRAHLVLEQLAQRLDELHVHALGQSTHIVMRLDGDRRSAAEGYALDHIGVERALRQKLCATELACFLLEHVDEELSYGLSLLLGIGHATERVEKHAFRFDMHQRNIVAVAKERYDLLGLAEPQQAMIDENAGELLGHRLVNEDRRHRGIDPA